MKALWIILALVVVGGGIWFLTSSKKSPASGDANTEMAEHSEESSAGSEKIVVEKKKTEIIQVGEKMTNIVFDSKGAQYALITKVSLEVTNKKVAAELVKMEPKIIDILNTYFSSKTYEEIRSADRTILKTELRSKIDELVTEGRVLDVLFEQFVFQAL